MRFSNAILVLAVGAIGAIGLAACDSETGGGGGSGGSGSTGSNTTTTGSGNTAACSPTDPVCTAVQSGCIALEDYSGKDVFSLRMAQLSMTAPSALTKGIVKNVVQNGVLMNLPKCNLGGGGTFSWILQFDKANNKLKTGGAKPVSDPTKGYTFVNETVAGAAIAPVTVDIEIDASGKFISKQGIDLFVPIFLDAEAKSAVVLPLKAATLEGTLSDNNNCIGKYNAEGLDPANNCLGDDTTPTYIDAGKLDGYITLEDADKIDVSSIGQSLCVLLSGDAGQYGDGGKPINRCKRDANMKIVFKGDWCDATNMAAGGDCADAVRLGGTFAASAVKVN